ncbi:MAG: relaxase/mobilization nuclease domain-containing protein [Clostridiales bacterium]|nr:relaxase/mobilization nuclease domain-containing protein [Clostridiales bacterium]
MAVTAIWAVKSRVDKALDYVMNPEKTIEKPELSREAIEARKAVGDVIDYAVNPEKTEQMMFVTGINCNPDTALDEFMKTKWHWGKTGGRLAYHGYQSFLEGEGEITAETAHEIGVKLAQEVWGDRFEVVVATHLNTGHYHNHFMINSVSFMDGYKYVRMNSDYDQMRTVSDRLCKEYKLNVIDAPTNSKGKSYDECIAERQGKTTVRGSIREDIDYAIRLSHSEKEFARTMKELGYEFKFFKKDGSYLEHPGIKPPGSKGYFRFRSLGPDYEYNSIRRRIIENTTVPGTPFLIEDNKSPSFNTQVTGTGLPSMYRRYCIRLYAFISKPKRSKREYIPMALREDIAKLDRYIAQMDFLYQHNIENTQTLESKKDELASELKHLIVERRKMYTVKERAVRQNNGPLIAQVKTDISNISRKIREIRKQLALCEAVAISSERVIEGVDAPNKSPEIAQPKPQVKKKHRF